DLALEVGREGRRRAIRRRADQHRAGRLDGDVLALLALLAREAPARTIAAATAQPEPAVLDALTGLAAAGLARLGEHGWAPAHDLVGETVVSDLEPAQRGRLHALLAAALEADDADPSEIARHHRDAGDLGAAAAWYAGAARAASTTHATREAAALADAGLALAPRVPLRAALLEVRAEAQAAHGEIAGAEQDLTEALRLDGEGGADRARRLARLAMLTFGAQDPRRAAELAELAVVAAADDPMARAFALETAAIIDMNLGAPARAGERAEGALALYRTLGDAGGVAHILDGRAMATFLEGRIPAALDLFARVAQLFADAGELLRVVTPRSTLGHGLVFSGRADDGLTEIDEALRLARELDAPEGQAYALWHRAEALSALGRLEEAEASGRAALKVAEGAGHRGWTATAYRGIGITLQAQGRLDEAAAAFELSAAAAGDDLTLFACWAAARGAMVAVASGRLTGAGRLVARALSTGPPLGHYEGRLAAVELAVARGDDGWPALAAEALTLARSGGHEQSASRLASVLESRRSGA
ncbi:MAG: tetratricopeptide repeat protein, partial [Kineosporiaceae bacterium]